MGFAETLIYAVDTLEALAFNRYAIAGAVALVLMFAGSFAIGEAGARLRGGLARLGVFALIGAFGALAMVAVKGVPAPQSAEAPAPKAENGTEAWIARQQRIAAAERERAARTGPSPEARAVEAARLRLIERVEARRMLERERADIRRTPEAERTPAQRRRDADLDLRLAELDRADGRIDSALRRYRAAQAVVARLADPQARRAGVETALHTASALEEHDDTDGARAARTGPSPEARAVEAARLRLLERVESRQTIERERAEIRRTPEVERTPAQRRRDADLDLRLAELDRADGRIDSALRRYRAAQAVFARLADPQARRAGVETALHTASALEEHDDTDGARAAYRSAIDGQRGLVELPDRERRGGLASALLRYAHFETERREERAARSAIDEAAAHYAFLRAQRGAFDVIEARARLAIALGDGEAARGEIAGLRALLRQPALAALEPAVDAVEARLLLSEGRAPEAAALLARAVAALRKAAEAKPGFDRATQTGLATALLGLAEAGFAARDIAAARIHAGEAVAIRRALAEPRRLVEALVRLAVWEAGAGDADAAERALAAALDARRAIAEKHAGGEAEGAMRLLCAGALRGRDACRLVPDADATAAGP